MIESDVYHPADAVKKRNAILIRLAILGVGTVLSVVGYLIYSSQVYQIGFPLDDAWIHQTYARNFAGKWGMGFCTRHAFRGFHCSFMDILIIPRVFIAIWAVFLDLFTGGNCSVVVGSIR